VAELPADIVAFVAQLDDADRQAMALMDTLSDAQANWQPPAGAAWSITQCLDHMARTNQIYLGALKTATAKARPRHRPLQAAGWLSRFFLSKAEPPVAIKIKAPKAIQPPSKISKAEALAHFADSNKEVRQFAVETAGFDLCGVRFKNPFVKFLDFTVATGLLVIAAHNRRHLWQAAQVLKHADFPR